MLQQKILHLVPYIINLLLLNYNQSISFCQGDLSQSQRCNNLSHIPHFGRSMGQQEQQSSPSNCKFSGNVARACASINSASVNSKSRQCLSTIILVWYNLFSIMNLLRFKGLKEIS